MGLRFENHSHKTFIEFLLSWKSLKEGLLIGFDTQVYTEEDNQETHSLIFFLGPILFIVNKGIIG